MDWATKGGLADSCSLKVVSRTDFLSGGNGGSGVLISAGDLRYPSFLLFEFWGFVRAEYFFFFLVRRYSIDLVASRVLQVVGWLEVRGMVGATLFVGVMSQGVRHYSHLGCDIIRSKVGGCCWSVVSCQVSCSR